MENAKFEAWNNPTPIRKDNKKLPAGILAILLGPFGIHKFLLGHNRRNYLVSD
ncbi:TM2 domain-containing protein [Flavobacterium xanthum]|uniref:TM2 domain-containing protein n=1 Tax=Flavobacterium xanthum TaxID=69322 RepID=A0A1M7AKE3_9FLAO|nr:TM2 domain-containing protein [Flavobacterium xanthum]